jgi:hypothetical protein
MKKKSVLLGAAVSSLIFAAGCATDGMQKDAMNKTSGKQAMGECHGVNSCKGTGDCGGKGHMCAGKNSCKGKGWKKMSKSDCMEKGGEFKKM